MTYRLRNIMMLSLVLIGRNCCVQSWNVPHAQLTRSFQSRYLPWAHRYITSTILKMVEKDNADESKPSGKMRRVTMIHELQFHRSKP